MTLATLFEGQEETLRECLHQLSLGLPAREIAEDIIEPVLGILETNAGQALDPTYVVYIVEYARDSQ